MIQEQREEIENIIDCASHYLEGAQTSFESALILCMYDALKQQLNLRVDGEKLMESIINANLVRPQCAEEENHPIINVWEANASEQLEALVMECFTTEEKE